MVGCYHIMVGFMITVEFRWDLYLRSDIVGFIFEVEYGGISIMVGLTSVGGLWWE